MLNSCIVLYYCDPYLLPTPLWEDKVGWWRTLGRQSMAGKTQWVRPTLAFLLRTSGVGFLFHIRQKGRHVPPPILTSWPQVCTDLWGVLRRKNAFFLSFFFFLYLTLIWLIANFQQHTGLNSLQIFPTNASIYNPSSEHSSQNILYSLQIFLTVLLPTIPNSDAPLGVWKHPLQFPDLPHFVLLPTISNSDTSLGVWNR